MATSTLKSGMKITECSIEDLSVKAVVNEFVEYVSRGAVLIYGYSGSKVDFKQVSESYIKHVIQGEQQDEQRKNHITKKMNYKDRGGIKHKQITNKDDFFAYLEDLTKMPISIQELHIFCHAQPAGLSLGFQKEKEEKKRVEALNNSNKSTEKLVEKTGDKGDCVQKSMTGNQVVEVEPGLLTDHLIVESDWGVKNKALQQAIRTKFSKEGAFIKLWGCKAGEGAGHEYKDTLKDSNTKGLHIYTEKYIKDGKHLCDDKPVVYWNSLNIKDVIKPAMAQAIANFFGVITYASSTSTDVFLVDPKDDETLTNDAYRKKYSTKKDGKLKEGPFPSKVIYQHLEPIGKGEFIKFEPEPPKKKGQENVA